MSEHIFAILPIAMFLAPVLAGYIVKALRQWRAP